jgi:hypothetical protein
MAYGNWGAFVYKNGKRQKTHEDNTPYMETELESGYWQAFMRAKDNRINCHHAVMGDGESAIRLCGYKCYPVLFDKGEEIDLKQFYSGDLEHGKYLPDDYDLEFKYKDHEITISRSDNFVDLWMKTPDGDVWNSHCGYEYGAGHDD